MCLALFTNYYKYSKGGAIYTTGKGSLIAHPYLFVLLASSILLSLVKIYAYCNQRFSGLLWLRIFQLNGHYFQIIFAICTLYVWADKMVHAESITCCIIVLHAYQIIEDVQELFIRLEEAKYARILRKIDQLNTDPEKTAAQEKKKSSTPNLYKSEISTGITKMHAGFVNMNLRNEEDNNTPSSKSISVDVKSRKNSILLENNLAFENKAMDRSDSVSALSSYKSIFPESHSSVSQNFNNRRRKTRMKHQPSKRYQQRLQSLQKVCIVSY